MATVTTVSPTVTVREHAPGIPDDGAGNIAGELDLGTTQGWTFVASFIPPTSLGLAYNAGGPSVDIGQGRVARTAPNGRQELVTFDAETGVALASGSKNYLYVRGDNSYEIRDQDNPPGPDALLAGIIDTTSDTVTEAVRGRSPVSQFNSFGSVWQEVASDSVSINAGAETLVATGVTDETIPTIAVPAFADGSALSNATYVSLEQGSSTATQISTQAQYAPGSSEWKVNVRNDSGVDGLEITWHLFQATGSGGAVGGGGGSGGTSTPSLQEDYQTFLYAGGGERVFQIQDGDDYARRQGYRGDYRDSIQTLAPDPTTDTAYAIANGNIRAIDISGTTDGVFTDTDSFSGNYTHCAYDPTNNYVAVGKTDFQDSPYLEVRDATDFTTTIWSDSSVSEAIYMDYNDAGELYSVVGDGVIKKWDATGTELESVSTSSGENIYVTPNDEVVTHNYNSDIQIYDSSLNLVDTITTNIDDNIELVCVGTENQIVASGAYGIELYQRDGTLVWSRETERTVYCHAITPTGKVYALYSMVGGDYYSDTMVLDAADGSELYQFNRYSNNHTIYYGRRVTAPRPGAFPSYY